MHRGADEAHHRSAPRWRAPAKADEVRAVARRLRSEDASNREGACFIITGNHCTGVTDRFQNPATAADPLADARGEGCLPDLENGGTVRAWTLHHTCELWK